MKPKIKNNELVNYYSKWLSATGSVKKVIPLSFEGFRYNQNRVSTSTGFGATWGFENRHFISEEWICLDIITGEKEKLSFRHEVFHETLKRVENETSLHSWKEELIDNDPIILIDSYEEVLKGSRNLVRINPRLVLRQKNLNARIEIIKQLLEKETDKNKKRGLFLYLRHKQSPTGVTLKGLNQWKQENITLYNQIIQEIHGCMM